VITKTCTKCHKELPATTEHFFVCINSKSGLRSKCKTCMTLYNSELRKSKEFMPNTDETIKKKCIACGQEFPATVDYFFKGYCLHGLRSKCKTCHVNECGNREKTPESRQKAIEHGRQYYQENKVKFAERWQKYYKANADYLKAKAVEWGKLNLDKRRITDAKRRENPKFRLSQSISRSIRQCLFRHNSKDGAPWESLVDFTRQELVAHLEKKFQSGMNWDNYGEWHIDHKIPISAHNFSNPGHEDFKRCWSLSNLQPMWAKENKAKNAKLKKHFQPRLQMEAA